MYVRDVERMDGGGQGKNENLPTAGQQAPDARRKSVHHATPVRNVSPSYNSSPWTSTNRGDAELRFGSGKSSGPDGIPEPMSVSHGEEQPRDGVTLIEASEMSARVARVT